MMALDIFSAAKKLGWQESRADAALRIFNDGGVQFGRFKLKNPKLSPSPIYLNLRSSSIGGPLSRDTINAMGLELFLACEKTVEFDLVAGIPNAGVPFESPFFDFLASNETCMMDFYASFKKEGSGEVRRIVDFRPRVPDDQSTRHGGRVLILDDVLSGADTKLEACAAVEKAGCEVAAILVYVDREQGGREILEARGYNIISVHALSDLLEFYVLIGAISRQRKSGVMRYTARTKKIIGS